MIRGTDRKKRNRAATFMLESLDDRVARSASRGRLGRGCAVSGGRSNQFNSQLRSKIKPVEYAGRPSHRLRSTRFYVAALNASAAELRQRSRRRLARMKPGTVHSRDHPRRRGVREKTLTGK